MNSSTLFVFEPFIDFKPVIFFFFFHVNNVGLSSKQRKAFELYGRTAGQSAGRSVIWGKYSMQI